MKLISGWKTHGIGWIGAIVGALALLGLVPGIPQADAIQMIQMGLGLSALRSGVANVLGKP
jgi:hypothetical protein